MLSVIARRLRHGVPPEELCSPWDRRAFPIYALILFNLVSGMMLVRWTGIEFGREFWFSFLGWPALAIIGGLAIRRLRHPRVASVMELMGLIYGQGIVAFLVIMPLTRLSLPFADAILARADAALGFDWKAYEVGTRAYLKLFLFSYRSFTWQPALVIISLVVAGRTARALQFVTAGAVALALCSFVFPFFPAEGPFYHYQVEPSNALAAYWTNEVRPLFVELKSGALRHVNGKLISGLVAFPSYHAAAAFLFAWAAWPLRRLRWPVVLLNCLMLASIPTIGAHYLVDLLGGLVVGIASAPLAGKLICYAVARKFEQRPVAGGVPG